MAEFDEYVIRNIYDSCDICTKGSLRTVFSWLPQVVIDCNNNGKICTFDEFSNMDIHERIKIACFLGGDLYAHVYSVFMNNVHAGEYRWGSDNKFFRVQYKKKIVAATEGGHANVLKHFIENIPDVLDDYEFISECILLACDKGHLDAAMYLSTLTSVGNVNARVALVNAAYNGQLEIVKFLHETFYIRERFVIDSFIAACTSNKPNIAQYLYVFVDEEIRDLGMTEACRHGSLDVVMFLHSQGVWINRDMARDNGHMDVVQFACSVAH